MEPGKGAKLAIEKPLSVCPWRILGVAEGTAIDSRDQASGWTLKREDEEGWSCIGGGQ